MPHAQRRQSVALFAAGTIVFLVAVTQSVGVWVFQPSLPGAREGSSVAVNGVVYTTGADVLALDPQLGRWVVAGQLVNPRVHHATVAVGSDIYIIGGEPGGGETPLGIEVFHTTTGRSEFRTSLPAHRFFLGAAAIDNTIYVLGGKSYHTGETGRNDAYDVSTNRWTEKAPMSVPRFLPAVTSLNGRVYAIGGAMNGAPGSEVFDTVEAYDPATNRWTTLAPLPFPIMSASAQALNGKVYVTGGFSYGRGSLIDVLIYDPATNTWTNDASMNVHRSLHGSAVLNEQLYVVGGLQVTPEGRGAAGLASVEALGAGGEAPVAPTNLEFAVTGSTLTLTWRAPTTGAAPDSYIIEAGSRAGAYNLAIFNTGNIATALAVPNVPLGTYFIRVRAHASTGVSGPSNEIIVIVAPAGCPAPSNLTAAVTDTTVTLQWAGVAGASTYLLDVGTGPGRRDLGTFDLHSTATSFTVTRPSDGNYWIRVRAQAPCGTSVPSNEVIVRVASGGTPPGEALTGLWEGTLVVREAGSVTTRQIQVDFTQAGARLTGVVRNSGTPPVTFDLNQSGANVLVFLGTLLVPNDTVGCQAKQGSLTAQSATRMGGTFNSACGANDIDLTKVDTPTLNPTIDTTCPPSSLPPNNCPAATTPGVTLHINGIDLSAGPPGVAGPFALTLAGLPLSGTGTSYVRVVGLSPGVFEVSGQLVAHAVIVNLIANRADVPGGPVAGSIQNIEGPLQTVMPCGIRYLRSTDTGPMPFRFRFTLTSAAQPPNDPTACPG